MDERVVGACVAGGLGVLFGGLAVLLYTILAHRFRRARAYRAAGGTATGVVVHHEADSGEDGGTVWGLVVDFTDGAGQPHQVRSFAKSSHPVPQGSQLAEAYDTKRPGGAVLVDEARQLSLLGLALGGLFAGLACVSLVVLVLILVV